MNHKIKMIGLDLDGTLLTSDKRLTSYTKSVLEKAMDQGVEVLVATGRPISAVPKEILEIPGMRYALTSNSARILNVETNEVVHANTLPVEKVEIFLDILDHYDAIQEIFIDGVAYVRRRELDHAKDYFINPNMAEYIVKTRVHVDNVRDVLHEKNLPVDKIHGMFKNEEDTLKAYEEMKGIPGVVIASSIGNNWEINKEGTDKGKGLLRLGEMLGIKREEIMACGDGMNDLEMLKTVGFAVAMENGVDAVKEVADYITVTNNEDGVAKAIEKFVLQEVEEM